MDEPKETLSELVRRAFNAPPDPIAQSQRETYRLEAERSQLARDADRAAVQNVEVLTAMAASLDALVTESKAESTRTWWLIAIAALTFAAVVATLVATLV